MITMTKTERNIRLRRDNFDVTPGHSMTRWISRCSTTVSVY